MSDSTTPWTSAARSPCPSPTPGVHPNPCPLSQWCHPTISSSVVPFSSSLNLSQHQGVLQWVNSSHQVAKVLELQLSIITSSEYSGLISFRMDFISEPDAKSFLCLWEVLGCGILEAPTRCQPWGRGNGFQTEFISSVGHSFSILICSLMCYYMFSDRSYTYLECLYYRRASEQSHLTSTLSNLVCLEGWGLDSLTSAVPFCLF